MTSYKDQVEGLASATAERALSEHLLEQFEQSSELLLLWLQYLKQYHLTGVADALLGAVESTVREAAGCLVVGMVRPAIFSLRAQIDLLLGWIYFKDHSVEWARVNTTGDGFMLKRELIDYMGGAISGFAFRHASLKQCRTRSEEEPYRLLSAHIHGQSEYVLPAITDLSDLIRSKNECEQCVKLAHEVAEYLSDVLVCIHVGQWHLIPQKVRDQLIARFVSISQQESFFAGKKVAS